MSSSFQNRLLQYEIIPQEKIWDEIESALDTNLPVSLTEKLYGFEEKPEDGNWKKINAALTAGDGKTIKHIPFFKRYTKHIKYAAAIAILFLITITSSLLISKKTLSETAVTNHPKNNIVDAHPTTSVGTREKEITSFTPVKTSHPIFSQPKKPFVSLSQEPMMASVSLSDNFLPKTIERNSSIALDNLFDNYMVYSNGDGNAIRLPRKLFDAIVCSEQDIDCKEHLKTLQQKISVSALSTDFSGLLEILNNLSENQ